MEKDKNILIQKLKYLEQFLSKDVIDYLYSLINLEITVFNHEKYNSFLKDFDLFLDIACYNLYGRSVKLINNGEIPTDLIQFRMDLEGSYSISYYQDSDYDFLRINKSHDNKCNLYYQEIFDSNKELEKCEKELEKLTTESRLYCKPSYLYFDVFSRETKIKEKMEFIKKYGSELELLTDLFNKILLKDWNFKPNENIKDGNDRELVNKTSWCRVYKMK